MYQDFTGLHKMKNINLRFANSEDAVPFAEWAANNEDIPRKDIESAMAAPGLATLVVEIDGTPILYVPLYAVLNIAYLGFNPAARRTQRLVAMDAMLKALEEFARQNKISEVQTLSKEEYPIAKWAIKHGFKVDSRNPLTFEVR